MSPAAILGCCIQVPASETTDIYSQPSLTATSILSAQAGIPRVSPFCSWLSSCVGCALQTIEAPWPQKSCFRVLTRSLTRQMFPVAAAPTAAFPLPERRMGAQRRGSSCRIHHDPADRVFLRALQKLFDALFCPLSVPSLAVPTRLLVLPPLHPSGPFSRPVGVLRGRAPVLALHTCHWQWIGLLWSLLDRILWSVHDATTAAMAQCDTIFYCKQATVAISEQSTC